MSAITQQPTLATLRAERARRDPSDMMGLVERFAEQCRDAWQRSASWTLASRPAPRSLVMLGMGGSAIGADLLKAWLEPQLPLPVTVSREYEVPGYVGADTLVIAVSYSGNTEETLAAFEDAHRRGASLLGITTGGTLRQRCAALGVPCFALPPGLPPRASLPYSFFSLLRLLQVLGIHAPDEAELADLLEVLDAGIRAWGPAETGGGEAFDLARALDQTIPVIYGAGPGLATVATRWKCQINENAKMAAASAALPEANHNEMAGYSSPQPQRDYARLALIMLSDDQARVEVRNRAEVTAAYLRERLPLHEAAARGRTRLARMFGLVLLGDFVSVYLAWLRGVDPTPVDAIEWLKQQLAARRGSE